MKQLEKLIFERFEAQSSELREFSQGVLARLAAIETELKRLIGNGQPGSIDKMQVQINSQAEWIARRKGEQRQSARISAVVSGIVSLLFGAVVQVVVAWMRHR
jgi:hypothetical protein